MRAITATCAITLALVLGLATCERKNWVLLIAGSKGYSNYRHQAGICHAYQIAVENRIPEEHIVNMIYDDVAYHELNPYPGELINQPDGPNVYEGCSKAYTGDDITAEVVLAVLQGDTELVKKLTGIEDPKVIASGPDDHIFVVYIDHGGSGLVSMPFGDYLYATELNDALQSMYDQKRYAKLVFYMEACNSGSMFDELLPTDTNVYVTTSANPDECSWGCYFDEERDVCLGSYYSVHWMENCDAVDIFAETLEEQYQIVRDMTTTSHVMQYGDHGFTSFTVGDFLGNDKRSKPPHVERQAPAKANNSLLAPDEVGNFTLEQLLKDPRMAGRRSEIRTELDEQLKVRSETDALFSTMAEAALPNDDANCMLNTYSKIKQRSAYEFSVRHLMRLCPGLSSSVNEFASRRLNLLVNLTNKLSLDQVLEAVYVAAQKSPLCNQ